MSVIEWLLHVQGVYFFLTGVWPVLHMPSFIAVTGRKTDIWLVRTVGLLIAVAGLAMIAAGAHGIVAAPVLIIALGSAAALAAIDVVYVALGTIATIYLLDATVEIALLTAWAAALLSG